MRYAIETSRETPGLGAQLVRRVDAAAGRGREPRLFVVTLTVVAVAIVLAVAVLPYHFAYSGDRLPSGLLQGAVVWTYTTFGFLPVLLFCLFALLWGSVAFVTGRLRDPMRRLCASFLFAFCFAVLLARLGGNGGTVAQVIAGRLAFSMGAFVTFTLLMFMTSVALLLATDWFFFRTFRSLSDRARAAAHDEGVELVEEDGLAAAVPQVDSAAAEADVEAESPRRSAMVAVPASTAVLESDTAARHREQALMDRILEEARQDLLVRGETEAGAAVVDVPEELEGEEEVVAVVDEEESDLFADLEDEDLLAKAGEALERAWSEGADVPQGIAPTTPITGEDEHPADEVRRPGERPRSRPEETEVELPRPTSSDLLSSRAEFGARAADSEDEAEAIGSEGVEDEAEALWTDDLEDATEELTEGVEPEAEAALIGDVEEKPEEEPEAAATAHVEEEGDAEDEEEGVTEEPPMVLEPAPRVEIYDPGKGQEPLAPVQQRLFEEEPPDPSLLDRAAEIVLTARRPTPTLLQRRLEVSFAQARQTLEYLARLGVVEPPEAGGPWMPLIDLTEWEARRA